MTLAIFIWTRKDGSIYYAHMNMLALTKEVKMLRSFAISIVGRDPEGEYRPEFVRKILRAANEKPQFRFSNAKEFLAQIRKADV